MEIYHDGSSLSQTIFPFVYTGGGLHVAESLVKSVVVLW